MPAEAHRARGFASLYRSAADAAGKHLSQRPAHSIVGRRRRLPLPFLTTHSHRDRRGNGGERRAEDEAGGHHGLGRLHLHAGDDRGPGDGEGEEQYQRESEQRAEQAGGVAKPTMRPSTMIMMEATE